MGKPTTFELERRLEIAAVALSDAERRATAGQLALELMHDVRNPLEAIGNLAYLTLHEADNADKVRECMEVALEQMAAVRELADRTLGYAQNADVPRNTDLVHLVEAALRIHRISIESKSVRLVKVLPANVVMSVHTGEILQVVSNLILNSLDALHTDGELHVRISKHGGEVHLVVADNGHGIPIEHRGRIFQPYFTTKPEKGTGLGLALSKRIIERHHGRLRMRTSVRPGRSGTAFRLSLPLH